MKRIFPLLVVCAAFLIIILIVAVNYNRHKISNSNSNPTISHNLKQSSFLATNSFPLTSNEEVFTIACVIQDVYYFQEVLISENTKIRAFFKCVFLNKAKNLASLNVVIAADSEDSTYMPSSIPFKPSLDDKMIIALNEKNEFSPGRTVSVSFLDPTNLSPNTNPNLVAIFSAVEFESLVNGLFTDTPSTYIYPHYISTDHNGEKYVQL